MTLDGCVPGPNQSVENPLGEGGDHLHDWLFNLRTFRAIHGDTSGGETGTNDDVLREAFENVGATIMGQVKDCGQCQTMRKRYAESRSM
jgi:hypothetical protein